MSQFAALCNLHGAPHLAQGGTAGPIRANWQLTEIGALSVTRDPDVTIIVLPASDLAGCEFSYAETLPPLLRSLASIGDDPTAEIIVAEGLAEPAMAAWLTTRAASDPRLTLPPTANCGPARARNLAIAAARAPLVAFLEAGDVWCPGRLGPQRALHAGHPRLGFSFTDAWQSAGDGEGCISLLASWPNFYARHGGTPGASLLGADALAQLAMENVVATSTVVACTELLRAVGGFSLGRAPTAAWDLWLRLAGRAPVACRPIATAAIAARQVPVANWAAA
jgi:hypothetical protein